jgi:uncharacterized protein (TIGR02145 family)
MVNEEFLTGNNFKRIRMKKVRFILSAVVMTSIMLTSCTSLGTEDKESSNETVLNNKSLSTFKKVTIGKQIWMAENLNVDKFRNGEPIPEAKTDEEWNEAEVNEQAAWCYYENNPANGEKYGKLYNWYAVIDPRGLAPEGWHCPNDEEWTKLTDYLGGSSMFNNSAAADKMKSAEGWDAPDKGGCNSSGFSGIPGGYRWISYFGMSSFSDIRKYGYWWSTSRPPWWFRTNDFYAYCFFLQYENADLTRKLKYIGFSVRCVKD